MSSGGGNFEGSFRWGLPFDIPEIDVFGRAPTQVGRRVLRNGGNRRRIVQESQNRIERVHRVHGQTVDDCRLAGVRRRDHQCAAPGSPGPHGHGEHAADRAHRAVEPQLSQEHHAFQAFGTDLSACREDGDRYGEVERRPGLARIGGREIDDDAFVRGKGPVAMPDRRPHALPTFLHRGIGQPDDRGARHLREGHMDFHTHSACIDPRHRRRFDQSEHCAVLRSSPTSEAADSDTLRRNRAPEWAKVRGAGLALG